VDNFGFIGNLNYLVILMLLLSLTAPKKLNKLMLLIIYYAPKMLLIIYNAPKH